MRGEKFLVDCVLALYREERNATKLQLFIEPYGILIIVQNREIDMAQTASLKMLGKFSHQFFTDTRLPRLRMNCQTPKRSTAIRIIEKALMVDARYSANNFAGSIVLSHEIGNSTVVSLR